MSRRARGACASCCASSIFARRTVRDPGRRYEWVSDYNAGVPIDNDGQRIDVRIVDVTNVVLNQCYSIKPVRVVPRRREP